MLSTLITLIVLLDLMTNDQGLWNLKNDKLKKMLIKEGKEK